ncbi:MAG: hypothetical protein ACOY3K_06655 [Candidatus Omnitrophota bacterium]
MKSTSSNAFAGRIRYEKTIVSGALLLLLFIFYPGLFLVKEAFLTGDHGQQHYPWFCLLAQSLRAGYLPFWTPWVHAGFPIAAEGQIGVFYLPNLILAVLLPVNTAYAYLPILHFAVSGLGLYLYCRKIGLNLWGSFLGSVLFLFGSAYGGAYYNITSLKTIAWLPWGLYFFESYLERRALRHLFAIAVCTGLSLLAGYLQIAFFCLFFFVVYVFVRIFLPDSGMTLIDKLRVLRGVAAGVAIGFLIAAPQLLLTFRLAILSNRAQVEPEFAYTGSLSPFVIMTCLFHGIRTFFRASSLYLGIFPIYFIFRAFAAGEKAYRPWVLSWTVLMIFFFLFALGRWSPLYVAWIKLTHLYVFRIPSKFIVFICMGGAILAAIGFSELTTPGNKDPDLMSRVSRKAARGFTVFIASLLLVYVGVYFLILFYPGPLETAGEWLIRNFIFHHYGHPHPLEHYLSRIGSVIQQIKEALAPQNPRTLIPLILCFGSLLLAKLITRSEMKSRSWKWGILALVLVDLYAISPWGVRLDMAAYRELLPENPVVKSLRSGAARGEIRRVFSYRVPEGGLSVYPSTNMLLGFSDLGFYSPLVMSRYYESIGLLGSVNDSVKVFMSEENFVRERKPLLDFLDVSHVLSPYELPTLGLPLRAKDPLRGECLYANPSASGGASFVTQYRVMEKWADLREALMAPGFDPARSLLFVRGEGPGSGIVPQEKNAAVMEILERSVNAQNERWQIRTDSAGFFVVPSTFFPGWQAFLDGQEIPVEKALGLFRAVRIPAAGEHLVEFRYSFWRALWNRSDSRHGNR